MFIAKERAYSELLNKRKGNQAGALRNKVEE